MVRISFDINYRASFWAGREDELRAVFREIARVADILIGNEEDFQLALGIASPQAGGEGLSGKIDGFKEMIGAGPPGVPAGVVVRQHPARGGQRGPAPVGRPHYADDQFHVAQPREIGVLDRIGGGGFAGGMLFGILRGWDPDRCLQFGWASGALAATFLTDCAVPAD